MKKAMTREERYTMMIETPVNKLIPKLAVPTIISMLVTSIYNMADTFFVSQISTSASAAVGIIFSVQAMIQAIGFMLGMGSGNCISRTLGSRDDERAERIAATGFFTALIVGALFCVCGLCMLNPLVKFLGATDTIAPYAKEYGRYILFAAPVMMGSFVLNNLLRAQGYAFNSMIGITTGGIINMILDPILIFGFDMGIAGAAIATAASQCISFGILLYQTATKEGCIRLKLSKFTPKFNIFGPILHAGVPSLCRQGLASVATACLNHAVGLFLLDGVMIDAVQAAMTGVSKITLFLSSALIGFGQGFQPVCGFNYGAKKYDRVLEAYFFCVRVAAVALVIFAVLGFVFAVPITDAIAGSTALSAEIAAFTFRAQLIVFPLQAWVMLCNMMLQNIGMTFRATVVAMARQGLAFIPMVFLLPAVLQLCGAEPLLGLECAQAAADVISFLISLPIGIGVIREMREAMKKDDG